MAVSAFIWDLDGTLIDSYEVMVESLYETYLELGAELDKDVIMDEIKTTSVSDFHRKMEKERGILYDDLKDRYAEISRKNEPRIRAIKNAAEILKFAKDRGIGNFVFTHRGASGPEILKNNGLYEYFDEIASTADGFKRKPDPEGINYLVEKNGLVPEKTFYVGDRTLDIESADNAGIKSILYLPEGSIVKPTGKETYIVGDLLEIKEIV